MYYWMKLQNDFFDNIYIKKLRKLAGGDTYTIIYLKMQLLSLKTNGKLYYHKIENTFPKEIATEIDEDEDNVEVTIGYLIKCNLIEEFSDNTYVLPNVVTNTGSSFSKKQVKQVPEWYRKQVDQKDKKEKFKEIDIGDLFKDE